MDVTATSTGQGLDQPDDRDLDDGGLDLTPRDVGPLKPRGPRRRWGALVVLALLGVALVFIVIQARGASLYFKNADEAVAQRVSLGTRTFRLQGTVVGTPRNDAAATYFTVEYHNVKVDVRHTGSEPAMFAPGIPVVAEGHWNAAGTLFESERLLVKHDETYSKYDKAHPDRVSPKQKTKT